MNHEKGLTSQHRRLAATALAVIRGEVNPIEGCRLIVELATSIGDLESAELSTIRAIESDTKEFALGDDRKLVTPERFANLDENMKAYLEINRDAIFEACELIVTRYSDCERSAIE